MKLLLTHAYFIQEDEKEQAIVRPYAPLGILYLSSHLRAKGFEVDIYDSTFGSKQEIFRLLSDGPPGALGVYANLMTRGNAVEIAQRARDCGWTVILGGPEPANYPDQYLANGADVVVTGEGELALESLLRTNCRPEDFASIDGIYFRTVEGRVVRTSPGRLIPNLDDQPWPDRDRICLEKYLAAWRTRHGSGSVSLITARGCPYHCNWCSHSVYGQTHRRRSPKPVVDEVAWILDRYNPEMLWLADDVFTIHHGWLFEYSKEMKARELVTPFECITRADRLNEKIVDTLAELKCFRVWIGSESGSQRILNAMQRGVTVDQVQRAVGLCKARGIQTGMFLMWGYEGEEIDDVEATVDHVKACRPDVFFTTVSYPIKGTPYFERVSDRLVRIDDWARSTDRDFKIRGRHSRNFYKNADRLLRSEMAGADDVRIARAALHESALEVEA